MPRERDMQAVGRMPLKCKTHIFHTQLVFLRTLDHKTQRSGSVLARR